MIRVPYPFKTTYHNGISYHMKIYQLYIGQEGSSNRALMYHKEILIKGFQQDLEHQGANRQVWVLVMSVQLIRSLEGIYHKGLQYMMHREHVIVLVQIKIGMHSLLVP